MKKSLITLFITINLLLLISCSVQNQPLRTTQNTNVNAASSANTSGNAQPTDVNSSTPQEENKVLNLFQKPKARKP